LKIAIYHNLNNGGAIFQLENLIDNLNKDHEIHVFSPNRILSKFPKIIHHYYEISVPKNIFGHLKQAIFELPKIGEKIANDIKKDNFDVSYVFPCAVLQSPDVLRFLNRKKTIYFFAERKREFYEKTSYNHNNPRKIIARIIRLPVYIKDYINCRHADKIIVNSQFSKQILRKTYGKDGVVIYPGLRQVTPVNVKIVNTDKAIIVGQISYIKGYDLAIRLLSESGYGEVTVIGRKTDDFQSICKLSEKYRVKIKLIETENNNKKNTQLKRHGVFLACQRNEPFGITTLEACYNNNIVIGLNEGGTPEIIHHGLNGFLFERGKIRIMSKILKKIRKQKVISFTKINTIDWKYMTNNIIKISNE